MKKQSIFIAIILSLAAIASSYLITPQALCEQVTFYPAQVADISDRAYEQAVIDLLDKAQDSITISMFIIKPGDYDKHPINRLMRDLEEALERGVSVTIYLNTKTDETGQLNLPRDWDATALRRQVIKSLRKLKNRYGLIEVRFKHARAAEIELIDIAGETFLLKSDFFEASFLAGQRQNKKFVLLIKAYLQAQGKDIADFNNSELGRMFYVHRKTIGEGLR